jgi:hypothetical protein
MRESTWTPAIVPQGGDQNVCLAAENLGRQGGIRRESDCENADLETVIQDLLTGQYSDLIRVIAFDTAEGWSQEVPKTLRTNYAAAATCNCATYHRVFRILSNGMKGTIATSSSCVWFDGLPAQEVRCDRHQGTLARLHRAGAYAGGRKLISVRVLKS